jgi:ADYC domain-containing protein
MSSRGTFVVVIGLGLVACAIPEPDDVDTIEQSIIGGCTPQFCMTNSPQIATYGMFDFNVDGIPNAAGFAIWGLIKNNVSYDLVVRDSRIVGQIWGYDYLVDSDLIGAEIVLQSAKVGQVAIVIEDVGGVSETVYPYGWLQSYVLDWGQVVGNALQQPIRGGYWIETPVVDPNVPRTPLCHVDLTNWGYGSNPIEWDDAVAMFESNVYQSLVFEGDRVDPATRTVSSTPDNRWFNVGCDAHTLTKMRLSRNTINTGGWRSAQAALKMLSADYCGTGRPFTVDGEQLVWRARSGMRFYNTPATIEARWSEYGALCVGEPRLLDTAIPDAQKEFPDIWTAIYSECVPRKCRQLDPNYDEYRGEIITTANY